MGRARSAGTRPVFLTGRVRDLALARETIFSTGLAGFQQLRKELRADSIDLVVTDAAHWSNQPCELRESVRHATLRNSKRSCKRLRGADLISAPWKCEAGVRQARGALNKANNPIASEEERDSSIFCAALGAGFSSLMLVEV
jgi:hypothetical protein